METYKTYTELKHIAADILAIYAKPTKKEKT